jgi:site-specific recombinase XerD
MYDCAARLQEFTDLTPAMIRLTKPYTVKIIGKGNKPRIVSLMEQQVFHLKRYLAKK